MSGSRAPAYPRLRLRRQRRRAEQPLELPPQHHVDLRQRHDVSEIHQTGHAIARIRDAARHDAGEMRKLRIDVERDAVQADPALEPDADRGDLVFAARALLGPRHPHADAVLAPPGAHVEGAERADQPFLQRRHVAPHVGRAALQVEHQVDHALARPVIGELPAAADLVDREARIDQVGRVGAGAGGVERRVLEQPHQLGRAAVRDRGGARIHRGERHVVRHEAVAHPPFDRRQAGAFQAETEIVADVNHRVTIPW